MVFSVKHKRLVSFFLTAFLFFCVFSSASSAEAEEYIKWADFTPKAPLMKKLIELDICAHDDPQAPQINWIEALAYLAAQYGGEFSRHKSANLDKLLAALSEGKTMAELTEDMKCYAYYLEAYTAVLGGLVGEYETEIEVGGLRAWEKRYGLRAYFPLAKGFGYSDFDDFGEGRNYGYKRRHLGHDIMALTGTPVVACESGVVEELGWNQYGGWRVGIRSFDGLRYWYYAHLRQNRPYAENLTRGDVVMAGDVIGYVGHTGYSKKENTNGFNESHLHWGLQLIFDESQKDGDNQIWIDLFALSRLLECRRCETIRNPDTKEHTRVWGYRERVPEDRFEAESHSSRHS